MEKEIKRQRLKEYGITFLLLLIMTVLVGIIFLLIKPEFNLNAVIDALTVSFGVSLFFGWLFFINNKNFFSSVVYTFKTFFQNASKRREQDYFSYLEDKKQISNYIIEACFIYTFLTGLIIFLLMITR